MAFGSTIDFFINPKDKLNPETYRKGRFFVISYIIFFAFLVFAEIWVITSGFGGQEALIGNGIMCLFMFASFYIYKKYGKRVLLVNILSVFGYMSNYGTYDVTGGIFSSDLINGVVVSAWVFLVGNKRSGQVWFGVTFLTIIFLYVAAEMGWRDFRADAIAQPTYYPFMNYAFCCLFMAIIVNLYESNKEKYLNELSDSKAELELKNKDVTDSINYAKRIQSAVLPHEETIYRSIPLSFIYYKPKAIVSGDFFWFHEINKDEYILVCADCTGHGVPGAFMTVIASSLLNQTVIDNKITEPSKILVELDKQINFTLKQQKDYDISVQDGMDLSLVKVNKAKKEFIITGAKRPVAFIRDRQLQDLKGSKFSIGGLRTDEKIFDEIKINYLEGDMLYFYTDGYTDQFGGEKGKKFSSKRLKEHFLTIHRLSVAEQKQNLDSIINKWMNDLEQVDDMLVIGIKL